MTEQMFVTGCANRDAVIVTGTAKSNDLDFRGAKHIALSIPTLWVTAPLFFETSYNGEDDWQTLYDNAASPAFVAHTCTAGKNISLDALMDYLAPWRHVRICSGVPATPVLQTGQVGSNYCFVFSPITKYITITSGVKGVIGDTLRIEINTAAVDTLAVTADGDLISIDLANTTASKNSAANIQTALRALTTVNDISVAAMTCVGSTAYDAAPVTGVKAVMNFNFMTTVSLGMLTLTAGMGGEEGQHMLEEVTFELNTSDALAVSYAEATGILVKLANATASKNAVAALQTALRALAGTPYGANLTALVVAGDATYIANPVKTAWTSMVNTALGAVVGIAAITPVPPVNLEDGMDCTIRVVLKD